MLIRTVAKKDPSLRRYTLSWLFLLLASLAWVLFDICRKHLVATHHPLLVGAVFSLVTLPIYLLYWLISDAVLPVAQAYYGLASISGILAAIGAVSFIAALGRGRFSVLLPVLSLTPLVAALINVLFFSEILPWLAYVVIAICVFATFRLLGDGFKVSEPGAGYMLLATLSWGACICIDQYVLQFAQVSFHALWVNVIMLSVLLTALLFNRSAITFSKMHKHYWLLGLIGFSAAVLLQFNALRYLDASTVEAVKRAIGIISAMAIGRVFLHEQLERHHYLYGVVIIFSVLAFSQIN
jgi:drug/metabolite transporter (DMT)-like permease